VLEIGPEEELPAKGLPVGQLDFFQFGELGPKGRSAEWRPLW